MTISLKHTAWLDKRAIDAETATRYGLYSGRVVRHGDDRSEVVPDGDGAVLVFPFIDHGQDVGAKYRAAGKRFWQKPPARKTFWNADVLDDPALKAGTHALVITEGEIDALAVIVAGYPFAVSVPDGAPPARDKQGRLIVVPTGTADIDPSHDDKYLFIFNNWERLKPIRRIIIAVDNDEPGQRLAEELVRRLDRVRCFWIEYPAGCKDFDDVLMKHGAAEVIRIITNAREYPLSGLYRLSEIPAEPDLYPVSTGWNRLDDILKVFVPALMVVTGFAMQGKSVWTEQLVAHLARDVGWSAAIASFEMRVRPFISDTLATVYLGKPKWSPQGSLLWSPEDEVRALDWIERRFVFIAPDPAKDEDADIQWLIERAEAAVIRHGIRVLLIDPWNEVDHARRQGETQSEYTGRALRALKAFGRRFGVLVIVVAHPTKAAQGKAPDQLGLYDVSDSAHFANKADLGVVLCRIGNLEMDTESMLYVKKVRYQPMTGHPGKASMSFDKERRIFLQ